MQPSDQARLCRRLRRGAARAPGSAAARPGATIAGVISQATSSSDTTTQTGTASATITSGANTLWKPPAPTDASQAKNEASSDHCSSEPRTASIAGSQKN